MTDPALMGVAELAGAIRHRQLSSVEATRAALHRISQWQPVVNAFVRVEADAALARAADLDRAAAAGQWAGPLHGVPLAHKDMFARAGGSMTGGSAILPGQPQPDPAPAVARLEAAGAITVGWLNMSEFAAGPTGHNIHFGHNRNPWDPSRITGGSSAGSGAAVAARMVAGALGSDTGGSIRLPAAMNGLIGLKPTYGRVSRAGSMPRAWSLDTIGPLTRTAADASLMMAAISGHDPRDPTTSRRPFPDDRTFLDRSVAGLRVGLPPQAWMADATPEVAGAVSAAMDVLAGLGMAGAAVPAPPLEPYFALGDAISKSEAAAAHGTWMRDRPQDYSVHVHSRTEAGYHIPATRYLEAMALRGRLLRQFVETVMAGIDLMAAPILTFPVPTIAETDEEQTAAIPAMVARLTRYTRPFNYLGLPALALPIGFDGAGLPMAVQLVGRPFSEPLLLRVAHQYQQATGWHRRVPNLPA
ncbi:aspartyl-tRNA(Asn)/glutamyl-tRNA(Gln) amidotransferase subunit A [Stella humosa]|uniref:Aspartyl-tRNA(Asn)/glutamyl-tRNA(Gln) amidotransferase subunit A n=1 Tax=Stella humosa TaxID=94 RepID=A0A3N1M8A9_9PROT|nr:amidase [Stella humosa]ROP99910.1 aspartyl-tRNA(Asn)/glutamyl-tRNA(Gln) amidotransferase subunit A [Stella humosa]BBK30860.1 amidase [Stella humosa]